MDVLDCSVLRVRAAASQGRHQLVEARCRIALAGKLTELIRVDTSIAVVDASGELLGTPDNWLLWEDEWGPARRRLVDVGTMLSRRAGRSARAVHVTSAVYVGRWWNELADVALQGTARAGMLTARWSDALSRGNLRIRPGRAAGEATMRLGAALRAEAEETLAGAPLMVVRATLVSRDGRVLGTMHLPFDTRSGDPLGRARGQIDLPSSLRQAVGGRVRIDVGVARYRSARVGEAVALDGSAPALVLPDDPWDLLSVDESGEITWNLEDDGDHEPPAFDDCAVIRFTVGDPDEFDDGEDVRISELSARERANPSRLGCLGIPDDLGYEDPRLEGVRITAVDTIVDGLAAFEWRFPGTWDAPDDDGTVLMGSPVLRVHLSHPVNVRHLARALSSNTLSLNPSSRRRSGEQVLVLHGGAEAMSEHVARRWQAALLLGAGYHARYGLALAQVDGSPMSTWFDWVDRADAVWDVLRRPAAPERPRVREVILAFSLRVQDPVECAPQFTARERADLTSLCTLHLRWRPSRSDGSMPRRLPRCSVEVLDDGVRPGCAIERVLHDPEDVMLGWTLQEELSDGSRISSRKVPDSRLRPDDLLGSTLEPVLHFVLDEPMDPVLFAESLAESTIELRTSARGRGGAVGLTYADPGGAELALLASGALPRLRTSLQERERFSGVTLTHRQLRARIPVANMLPRGERANA